MDCNGISYLARSLPNRDESHYERLAWLVLRSPGRNSYQKPIVGFFAYILLQVIDIEHASMHMSYPLLPRHAANPTIQQLDSHQGNAFQGLAEMMHFGMSHFVGRGLPSIWSSLNADEADILPTARSPFTESDLQIIRHWARKLDDWLVRYNGSSRESLGA